MFSTTVLPSARAASSSTRLESDLLPGSRTSPLIFLIGSTTSFSSADGSDVTHLRVKLMKQRETTSKQNTEKN